MMSFDGGVYPDGGMSRVQATLTVDADGIHAVEQEREVSHHIDYRDMSLQLAGMDGDMLFCRSKANPKATIIASQSPGLLEAMVNAARGGLDEEAAKVAKTKEGNKKNRRFWASMVGVGVALVVLALVIVPLFAGLLVKVVPTSADRKLGDAAMKMMDVGPKVKDKVIIDAVEKMVERLAPHAGEADYEYRVQVVKSEQINAMALPGGQIVVYTGLLEAAERPEQVAGVLGHEIAHVTLRHGMSGLLRKAGLVLVAQVLLGDVQGLLALIADGAMTAVINGYSREQEAGADEEGVRLLLAAELDALALAGFFEILSKESGDVDGVLKWISTHPDHASRIAHVKSLVAESSVTPRPLEIDWVKVKEALSSL